MTETELRGALWEALITYSGLHWREVDRVVEPLVAHIIKTLTEKGLVK